MLGMCKVLAQPGSHLGVSARPGSARPNRAKENQQLQGCLTPARMELQPCKPVFQAPKCDTRQLPISRTPRIFPGLSQPFPSHPKSHERPVMGADRPILHCPFPFSSLTTQTPRCDASLPQIPPGNTGSQPPSLLGPLCLHSRLMRSISPPFPGQPAPPAAALGCSPRRLQLPSGPADSRSAHTEPFQQPRPQTLSQSSQRGRGTGSWPRGAIHALLRERLSWLGSQRPSRTDRGQDEAQARARPNGMDAQTGSL